MTNTLSLLNIVLATATIYLFVIPTLSQGNTSIALATSTDPTFEPGSPRFDAASDLLVPDESFPQFDPKKPTAEVILPQETKEYTNVYYDCTKDLTTEMEQPCNRIMLYLAGECEDNDMWLFCGEELSTYLRNHDLEDEESLKQTDIYEDYKLLNRLVVEQMADMPFEELVAKLEANQTGQ